MVDAVSGDIPESPSDTAPVKSKQKLQYNNYQLLKDIRSDFTDMDCILLVICCSVNILFHYSFL